MCASDCLLAGESKSAQRCSRSCVFIDGAWVDKTANLRMHARRKIAYPGTTEEGTSSFLLNEWLSCAAIAALYHTHILGIYMNGVEPQVSGKPRPTSRAFYGGCTVWVSWRRTQAAKFAPSRSPGSDPEWQQLKSIGQMATPLAADRAAPAVVWQTWPPAVLSYRPSQLLDSSSVRLCLLAPLAALLWPHAA